MNIEIDTNRCDQCGTCISVCSADALTLLESLIIDEKKCILCKNCVTVCPVSALKTNNN